MLQATYLKIPQNGDRGTVFCPAIAENFETLDAHTHDGVTSSKIPSNNIDKASVTLATASWALDTNGDYKQTVTLPLGYDFDKCLYKFLVTTGTYVNQEINPTVTKTSSTTFDLHVMTPCDLKVVIL